MEIRFYRCVSCQRLDELNRLLQRHKCLCGATKVTGSYASPIELGWFLIKHPSYLYKAFKGEELYGKSDNLMSNK
jgi:hypothetical protein